MFSLPDQLKMWISHSVFSLGMEFWRLETVHTCTQFWGLMSTHETWLYVRVCRGGFARFRFFSVNYTHCSEFVVQHGFMFTHDMEYLLGGFPWIARIWCEYLCRVFPFQKVSHEDHDGGNFT